MTRIQYSLSDDLTLAFNFNTFAAVKPLRVSLSYPRGSIFSFEIDRDTTLRLRDVLLEAWPHVDDDDLLRKICKANDTWKYSSIEDDDRQSREVTLTEARGDDTVAFEPESKGSVLHEVESKGSLLHEVELSEARGGDIAIFEYEDEESEKYIYTLLERNGYLVCDTWLGGERTGKGHVIIDDYGEEWDGVKNVHVYRWNEELCPKSVFDEPEKPGWYITATEDRVLRKNDDARTSLRWSRQGKSAVSWDTLVASLYPECFPLRFVCDAED